MTENLPKKSASVQTNLFGQATGQGKEPVNLTKNIFQASKRPEEDRINEEIIAELKEMDINNLTPIEAMNKLNAVIERVRKSYKDIKK